MNALSHEFDLSNAIMLPPHDAAVAGIGALSPDFAVLERQWEAVHEAAAAVGYLAQLASEPDDPAIAQLPRRAIARGGWRLEMVARGIDDLSAIMQPGLRALLGLTAAGKDTTAAALTLWREFHSARATILALIPTH